ncbi:MAG: DNA gyrase subunit A [Acidimicrobiia bacterium]|nr:DNA gyrase subunit A [Acidimicrobiia bacterium]
MMVSEVPSIPIRTEISDSFLEYSMSVIVSRALPDIRDGLKPVHRRILYAMHDAGLRANTGFTKCARVVGDVMGSYHPHGDSAIYDALVRLGQDFATRYLLIQPQGNFGSPDDPPAAMRYTECRMQQLAERMLEGIDEKTVDYKDTYDGKSLEPVVLPARFPNLLVNGSTGIAVGMATNIPPHNLEEVVDAITHTLENPDATAEELTQFIKGPDFPTGAYILQNQGLRSALTTGRGSIRMRAKADVVEVKKGRTAIVVTELPYQSSPDRIMLKIAELVRDKKIEGIRALTDQSSGKVGTRIVVDLKKDANPNVVLNQLFKMTPLQDTFGVNFVALVDGVPRTLNIADAIGYYIDHQMEVIERRTKFRLEKKQDRIHIVDGLLIALDNIEEVIRIIRQSKDVADARASLMETFKLSEVQTNHILDMPLRRLTAQDVTTLRTEQAQLKKEIKELEAILKSPAKQRKIISDDLQEIREKFGNGRRTRIIPDEGDFSLEDLIADEDLVVTVTNAGYIKAVPAGVYRVQGRGGRGVKAAKLKQDDVVTRVLHTSAHAFLLFFTNRGKVYRIKAHEIPKQDRTARGTLAQAVMPLAPDERIEAVIDTRDYESWKYLVIATAKGQVKKTKFSDYDSRSSTLIAIKIGEDDEVVAVRMTNGDNDLLLFTKDGMGIRFAESDIRAMGRDTQGVRGIKLREGDRVVSVARDGEGEEVLILTQQGFGKRTRMEEFPKQKRGGIGVRAIKTTASRGNLVAARAVAPGTEIFVISSDGIVIRQPSDKISRQKRAAQGVNVMSLEDGASLSGFALVPREETEE